MLGPDFGPEYMHIVGCDAHSEGTSQAPAQPNIGG